MNKQTASQKILSFFLTKIIIGIAVVGGSVFFSEWAGRALLNKVQVTDELKNGIIAITDAVLALLSYILLFTFYEKRKIRELRFSTFVKDASIGFSAGLILQSLLILVICMAGSYSVIRINPFSFILPAFTFALIAGFVAETIILGIIFRLLEEKTGTIIAILITISLFAIMHLNSKGATFISVLSTALQAGFLLPAVYVFTRSLWVPIFLHFAWDFAEPGIYGAINPGNNIDKSLFTSKITGSSLITGGELGPENSIQATILFLTVGLLLLMFAKRKHNLIKPYWKKLNEPVNT